MKVSHLIAALVVFLSGFAGGTFVAIQYPDLLQSTTRGKNLYSMLQQGGIAIGLEVGELVLPESIAYHERTDSEGRTLVTSVYQEEGQVLLLSAVDGKVTELTLWKTQYRAPDLYFVRKER